MHVCTGSTSSNRKVKVQANISYDPGKSIVHACHNEDSVVMQRAGSPGVVVAAANPITYSTTGNNDALYEYNNI